MNPSPEIAERLERLTGLIKNSQYRSYDIKVPKDDLRAALKLITSQAVEIERLRAAGFRLAQKFNRCEEVECVDFNSPHCVCREEFEAALNPSLDGGDDKSGGRHEA